jgi:hypothetical protein
MRFSPRRYARSKNISRKGPQNCRSLGSPGFPVESCGFGQLHVVLFRENHMSGAGEICEVGNPGSLLMNKRRVGCRTSGARLRAYGPSPSEGACEPHFQTQSRVNWLWRCNLLIGLGRVRPNEIRSVLFDRLLSRWQSLREDKRKPQISPLRYAPPDFLWNLVALAHLMLLSLTKAAHAAMSSAAWQEVRVRSHGTPGQAR